MAKVLYDHELADIISRAVKDIEIDDMIQYHEFLKDISHVIGRHFGADVGCVADPHSEGCDEWMVSFRRNDFTPEDGGVFKHYDFDGEL
jgi:hypothetical protein